MLNVRLKKNILFEEYLLKGPLVSGCFENPLSNLYCFTMKASKTEAKLIHQHIQQKRSFHFAMHSATEREQSASFVNFQFISNSSFENVTV